MLVGGSVPYSEDMLSSMYFKYSMNVLHMDMFHMLDIMIHGIHIPNIPTGTSQEFAAWTMHFQSMTK
jgi:hypothetical protein